MRPLILSCNTGAGHNTAGNALREQFLMRGVDCPMLDALSFASESISRFICTVYIKATIAMPSVFGACYKASEAISSPRVRSPLYMINTGYAHSLYRYLRENDIDTVVMPHVFPAQCLTHIKKKYRADIKTYLIPTDYDCWPFIEETAMDAYFIPHESLAGEYIRRGVPEERLFVSGIPTLSKFSQNVPKIEARMRLGLPEKAPILLLMSGSIGFGQLDGMVRLLRNRMPEETNIVVLGGNNEKLKHSLRQMFSDDARIRVLDFTTQADLYMDACDVLLTKPGGLTSTEAAVKCVPMVHTEPIPGCETSNLLFFTHFGMSASGDTPQAVADEAIRLLIRPELRETMQRSQKQNTNAKAASDIVGYIFNQAGE